MKNSILVSLLVTIWFCQCNFSSKEKIIAVKYPPIPSERVIECFFGKKIEDTYRTFENLNDKKNIAWLEKENTLYDSIKGLIPNQDKLEKEIEDYSDSTINRSTKDKINRWLWHRSSKC